MKIRWMAAALLLCLALGAARAEETRIEPQYPVPDYVTWLLEVAAAEIGYEEGPRGYTKYGEWAGNPTTEWCAEFLCWCVDQVDQRHGTALLRSVYPMWSGTNTGKNWFVGQGRYIVRWGNLENWGYQWFKGDDHFITTGSYIPQPGDYVFFTWTSDFNTDHVALVEYCTVDEAGGVRVHVIEGNTPDSVKRAVYDLTYSRILGYGTVRDLADWTCRRGCEGQKVLELQEKLARLGYLAPNQLSGVYDQYTIDAVTAVQRRFGLKESGIANIDTQRRLNVDYNAALWNDPATWAVASDDADLDDLGGAGDLFADDFWITAAPPVATKQPAVATVDPDAEGVHVVMDDSAPAWADGSGE